MWYRPALALAAAVGIAAAGARAAQDGPANPHPPEWAYHVMPQGLARPTGDGSLKRVPGSPKALTVEQVHDPFGPPDWYPDEHPAMPDVVARGRRPDVRACAQCHLPNGEGHPESSRLAGLPAAYIVQQMADYKSGARKSSVASASMLMTMMAKAATDADVQAAAEYFAALRPTPWTRVVEVATVPKTYVGFGNMRFVVPDGGTEPIGSRIIELPEDGERAELHDSHSGFVAHVPVGSIEKGRVLVTTGGEHTITCGICHGRDLKGLGNVPGLAGASAIHTFRQMYDIKHGVRTGPAVELMEAVVANLTEDDMVAIAAYTASLAP